MIVVGAAIAALAALAMTLAERRRWVPRRGRDRRRPTVTQHLVAACVLALCNAELLGALLLRRPILLGDLRSHTLVAREIAEGRATNGWIDVYHAGFPLGPHYPSTAWLLGAALMKLGVAPPWSMFVLGIVAAVATNALVYLLALRAGAPFAAALLGACTISLMAPFSSFLGGAPAVLTMGVISQVVAMPFVVVCAYEVLVGRSRAALALSAALGVATHPQIAVTALGVLAVVALARGRLRPWARAGLSMAVAGGAIFGPGLARLGVPFGWPPLEGWLILGRSPGFFLSWLAEGELLDFARVPVVTMFVACALVVLLLRQRRAPAAASALLAWGVTLAACVAGQPLSQLGRIGSLTLTFFQPLRAYALFPVASAAVVVVAAADVGCVARALSSRATGLLRRTVLLLPLALVVGEVAPLAPIGVGEARGRLHAFDTGPCGPQTPPGYDPDAVNAALARLGAGRLAYEQKDLFACATTTDLDFASRAPIATPFAAGAHVGVIASAFTRLRPAMPGSDQRAASLGITFLLQTTSLPAPTGNWVVREHLGPVTLYETPASYFGLGCRREVWRGDDRHMRQALDAALLDPASKVWSPVELIELDAGGLGAVTSFASTGPCDASVAQLKEASRLGPGDYRARVTSGGDVDLVLRETYFDWWRVEVDGARVVPTLVAPGFMSIHLSPGDHVVTASFATSWWYLLGLIAAACVIVALSIRRAW